LYSQGLVRIHHRRRIRARNPRSVGLGMLSFVASESHPRSRGSITTNNPSSHSSHLRKELNLPKRNIEQKKSERPRKALAINNEALMF